ncbi:hypothetical protein ACJX0J_024667 [Zea mays]
MGLFVSLVHSSQEDRGGACFIIEKEKKIFLQNSDGYLVIHASDFSHYENIFWIWLSSASWDQTTPKREVHSSEEDRGGAVLLIDVSKMALNNLYTATLWYLPTCAAASSCIFYMAPNNMLLL